MAIKNRLADLLREKGVTPYALTKKTGVVPNTIYRLVRDTSVCPSGQTLSAIYRALKLKSFDEILYFEVEDGKRED